MATKDNRSLSKKKEEDKKTPPPTPIPSGGFEVSLVLTIGDEEVIVTGKSLATGIKVEYRRPWNEAAELGTFTQAIAKIGTALGITGGTDTDFSTKITAFVAGLPAPLDAVAGAFMSAQIVLTDLHIDTTGSTMNADGTKAQDVYELGLGLKFSQEIKVGNIKLEAFLVKYTYYKTRA